MSNTLGTCVCCHSPGAWAALPAAVAGIAGPAPSGAVSSGGAGWGGAGAAAATRTSQPFESVNPLARRRGERRRGQRRRGEGDGGRTEDGGAPHHGHHRSQM